MRWLLTITFAAVASVSVMSLARADSNGEQGSSKENGRREPNKEQGGDRGDRSAEKNRESARKLKEEMEREEDRATSRLYGKPIRASVHDTFKIPAPNTYGENQLKTKAQFATLQTTPSFIQAIQFLWRHYSFDKQASAAARQ